MLQATSCSLCCKTCSGKASDIESRTPYEDLPKFLPAGTVLLRLLSSDLVCQHHHSVDGWHLFDATSALRCVSASEDEALVRLLEFLIEHHFICATCILGNSVESSGNEESGTFLYVRIYLIPWDLPNVQGKLRVRDEATVVSTARQYLKHLLPQIVQDDDLWEGQPSQGTPVMFFKQDIDNRTMAEIYSDLPSPKPHPKYHVDEIPGMRSKLYGYQKRSVSSMLSRELEPSSIDDPLYIPIKGIDESVFYLQPVTMEVLKERQKVVQTRGGILCEELGTGKTVMMLALILSTLDQLPSPEESILDPRPVLTPLAFRHFPGPEFVEARSRISQGSGSGPSERRPKKKGRDVHSGQFPSLVETLLHYCRTQPGRLDLRNAQELLQERHLWRPLVRNVPFYHHYELAFPEAARSRRGSASLGPKMMFLSGATLVVVPNNLFHQWRAEIMKHCYDVLRILEVRNDKMDLPRPDGLASYDIVLMTADRFSAEASKKDISVLHSWKVCDCPGYHGTRVPKCQCNKTPTPKTSHLLRIRWKRLVIDEGHVTASLATNATPFAKMLSVERKWIVTGTPTTNLLGLHFGEGSELQYPEDPEDSQASQLSADDAILVEADEAALSARKWTKDDREDLRKLATMIIHFLGAPQFSADKRAFEVHVIGPLMESPSPQPGAIQVLTQVMSMIMVRHRFEDVENDVLLPFLHQDTILLDLDIYAIKTYNVIQAGIVVNAIDSERVDKDYLFHPSNTAALAQLVSNMSQAMFWQVDNDTMFNIDELAKTADGNLARARERNVTQEDLLLLETALGHVKSTVADHVWRGLQAHALVSHRVHSLPSSVYETWTTLPKRTFHLPEKLINTQRLTKLKAFIVGHPLSLIERIIEYGEDVAEEERRRHELRLLSASAKKSRSKGVRGKDQENLQEQQAIELADTPERREEIRREFIAAQERLKRHFQSEDASDTPTGGTTSDENVESASTQPRPSRLLSSSPLVGVWIGNSTSSKLDYILNDVLNYAPVEKFLIFSSSPLTLAYISEALELVNIKFLQYTTRVQPKIREQLVTTFETSDLYRVFLMELQHGARGLNLVTATRVIFCEPVWQADVETQAIKRVHRIGQTKPVTVKTLAIRNTAEEVIVNRREMLKQRDAKQTKLVDDRRIRDFIANPTFLEETTSSNRLTIDIPLLPVPKCVDESLQSEPVWLPSAHWNGITNPDQLNTISTPDVDVAESEPPCQRGRAVHFASTEDDADPSNPPSAMDVDRESSAQPAEGSPRIRIPPRPSMTELATTTGTVKLGMATPSDSPLCGQARLQTPVVQRDTESLQGIFRPSGVNLTSGNLKHSLLSTQDLTEADASINISRKKRIRFADEGDEV